MIHLDHEHKTLEIRRDPPGTWPRVDHIAGELAAFEPEDCDGHALCSRCDELANRHALMVDPTSHQAYGELTALAVHRGYDVLIH